VCKTHHCLVDGVSGTELLSVILELSPESAPLRHERWEPREAPSRAELVLATAGDLVSGPLRQALSLRQRTARGVVEQLAEVAGGVMAVGGRLRPAASSSLNGPIGPHRRWAWASGSVDDVRAARRALGGTFNDVVLAAIAGGFRALLVSRGEEPERPLRTMVPVSVRGRDDSGRAIGDGRFNNRVSAMFADLPVHLADPVERLRAITEQMEGLKERKQALAGEALTSLAGFAPSMLLSLGTRLVTRTALRTLNTVTTNVPGPQLPLYVRGRRLLKAFPFVPLAGHLRVNVAIFSYDGQVNFGVTADYDSVPDVKVMCAGIEKGLAELAGTQPVRAAR